VAQRLLLVARWLLSRVVQRLLRLVAWWLLLVARRLLLVARLLVASAEACAGSRETAEVWAGHWETVTEVEAGNWENGAEVVGKWGCADNGVFLNNVQVGKEMTHPRLLLE